jgi:hypothetical protein
MLLRDSLFLTFLLLSSQERRSGVGRYWVVHGNPYSFFFLFHLIHPHSIPCSISPTLWAWLLFSSQAGNTVRICPVAQCIKLVSRVAYRSDNQTQDLHYLSSCIEFLSILRIQPLSVISLRGWLRRVPRIHSSPYQPGHNQPN